MIAQDVTEKNNRSSSTNLTIGPACMIMLSISKSVEFIKNSVSYTVVLKKPCPQKVGKRNFLFFNYLNLIFVSRNLLVLHYYVAFGTSCKYTLKLGSDVTGLLSHPIKKLSDCSVQAWAGGVEPEL
jgi:hypothetical protein